MDAHERTRIARAYVDYATWWVREGCKKFSELQATMREELAAENSVIARAGPHGLRALKTMLAKDTGVLRNVQSAPPIEEHPAEWSDERVREAIAGETIEGWAMIREIALEAPDADDVVGFIGAGRFEDWVNEERVVSVRDELSQGLKDDPKLLRIVCCSRHMPPALREILSKLGVLGADSRPT